MFLNMTKEEILAYWTGDEHSAEDVFIYLWNTYSKYQEMLLEDAGLSAEEYNDDINWGNENDFYSKKELQRFVVERDEALVRVNSGDDHKPHLNYQLNVAETNKKDFLATLQWYLFYG